MKANFQQLGLEQVDSSYICYWVKSPSFGFHWHYHRALEITYVVKGQGIRMVGDNMSYFQAGDMVLLGSNLPHTWISQDAAAPADREMEVVVLQFLPELFGRGTLSLPEFKHLRHLIDQAKRGISFSLPFRKVVGPQLERLTELNGVEGLLALFSLFDGLASDPAPKLLSSPAYLPALDEVTEQRILRVCQYIHEHYTEPLRISTLAELADMNTSAFSRFFTRTTGQTVTDYLTELRMAKACNLLITHPKMSISSVALQAGFNSQTLFNRCFKKRKGSTPREFRRQLQAYL